MLTLTSLSRAFGGLRVIDGLDLTVEAGEILGIFGPNGAGKSTLFNLIDR
jgi:ABC-type branched-subunit amino acid transport system ATPase component